MFCLILSLKSSTMNTTSLLLVLGCLICKIATHDTLNNKVFPDDFSFGVATSSYQIEGAWNEDGKGESVWDRFVHANPSTIKNNDTGDVACDSYHRYSEDVALLADLGVNHYRFSLSWSRLLPTGFTNNLNPSAVEYYKNLIKELKDNNIEPYVTLFHWDTPLIMENMGGWPYPKVITWFSKYARLCFDVFGDDVKYWMTFNEPKQTCTMGYGTGLLAPGKKSPGEAEYLCIHNLVRAHAEAWHIYNDEFRDSQQGQVGIVVDSSWFQPENNTLQADLDASETMLQFIHGVYARPVILGDYPEIVKEKIKIRSLAQGYSKSRLPEFTEEEKLRLAGTVDFLGVNMYTSDIVRPVDKPDVDGKGLFADSEVYSYQPDDWVKGADDWLRITPWGAGELVKWISKTYGSSLPLIVTENGFSDTGTIMQDDTRINYLKQYISSFKDAIDDHGVNIKGYTVWSLLDNFEWVSGYASKFGLYHVDFESEDRQRTAKDSATFYKNLIKTRCLVDECI